MCCNGPIRTKWLAFSLENIGRLSMIGLILVTPHDLFTEVLSRRVTGAPLENFHQSLLFYPFQKHIVSFLTNNF